MYKATEQPTPAAPAAMHNHGGHSHRWMMIICCIPMIAIALALVVAGVVSASFLLYAVICTLMMALMMGGMHGKDHKS